MKAPLILAYDHECPWCRTWMAWIEARDTAGLLVPFPLQNPELIRMAPELAGRHLEAAIHGVDTGTRAVFIGGALLPHILKRLPRWRWVAPLLSLPGVRGIVAWAYQKLAAQRNAPSRRGLGRH